MFTPKTVDEPQKVDGLKEWIQSDWPLSGHPLSVKSVPCAASLSGKWMPTKWPTTLRKKILNMCVYTEDRRRATKSGRTKRVDTK